MPTLEKLDRLPSSAVVVLVGTVTAASATIDLLTPVTFEAGLFYLPAIMLAAWRLGISAAAGVSLLAAVVRLIPLGSAIDAAAAWTAFAWLVVCAVIVILTDMLRRSLDNQQRLARTDALTGLANRTALFERIDAEINRSGRSGLPLSLAYIDCDDFKQVNDRFGHLTGDRLLQTIADTLRSNTRNYDVAARPGGDEFVLLLPETPAEQARIVIDRIRDSLSAAIEGGDWNVTLSVGVATFLEPPSSADELISAGDRLMYEVKQAGKNGVNYEVFETCKKTNSARLGVAQK